MSYVLFMTVRWLLFKLVLSGMMAKKKREYRKTWADENDQVRQDEMKRSTEEVAEERADERRKWRVTTMAKANNGQDEEVFQEIKEEDSGEKITSLLSESSEKREGHFYEQYYDWVFLWPTQNIKK